MSLHYSLGDMGKDPRPAQRADKACLSAYEAVVSFREIFTDEIKENKWSEYFSMQPLGREFIGMCRDRVQG